MTRDTKAIVIAVTGYVLTLLAYSFLMVFIGKALAIPVAALSIINFVVVFAFCVSPLYRKYLDWLEELALKHLPKGKDV